MPRDVTYYPDVSPSHARGAPRCICPPPSYSLHAPLIPRVWPAAIFHHPSHFCQIQLGKQEKCKMGADVVNSTPWIKTLGADESWSGG